MKRHIVTGLLALGLLASALPALAQVPATVKLCIPGTGTTCPPVTASNPMPVTGSFSATLSGFTPNGNYGTLTATAASSASTALPAGTVVALQNLSLIDVSCVLATGTATATTNKLIIRAGSTSYYTVGSNVNVACINQTGSASNVVAMAGGSGLGTAFGSSVAGGGGGGGAVTIADGADSTEGAIADAAATAGGTGTVSAKLRLMTTQLGTINTTLGSPFQAGGSIGNTSFGATQSGTWNITNISGTVSLPTGAATASNQTTAAAAKGQGATGAAVPSGAQYIGINSGGNLTGWNGAVTQSGTWTVQPGNTANTTAWLVTGTGGTFPSTQSGTWNITNVSGTVSLPTGASTAAKQPALGTAGSASSDVITVQGIASMTPLLVTLSGTNNINNISGTISLPTGAATAANQTSVIGTVAAGTAASNSLLTGAIFNSTPITVSNGQMAALQSDANGFLKVNVAAGGASGGTSSSFGAAFPGTGTAAGMSQGGNMVALTGTSGNLNVQCANCSGSGASATDATAFTAGASVFAPGGGFFQTTATNNALTNGQQGAWQMTANRAGFVNLRDTSGTAIGTSSAEVFVGGRGTAGSAAGGVLTVQGVASMTPLLTNPASATAPVSTMNSASAAAGVTAANAFVFDDVSPTAITENNFGYARMSANRNVYQTIRDAAGNERGANVDASNRLTTAPTLVSGSVASGAVASGAFASGSISSGAIAAGAQVDLLTMRGTKNGGTAATNSILAGLVYNATPLTLTDGQGASLQGDANGYLNVNVKTATGLAQGSTTSGQSGSLVMCAVTTSAPTYTTAQTSPLSCDTSGNLRISGGGGGGGAVTMASGAVASGAYSSGSIASGAFASGAVSSGAYASGSLASGAVVDITNLSTPIAPNTATATKGILNAGQYNSTQATFTNGQQGALQISSRGAQYVAVGADGFNVTNAGTFAVQIAANSSVNVAQINGVTPLMGNGATGTGSQRVTIANDSSAIGGKGEGATGATVPTGAVLAGAQSGANMVALIQASASAAINVSTATTTQLVALSGSTKIYVTSYDVIAGGTGNITFVYGTGSSCGTGTTSLTGAYNLTAQAGIAKGGGLGPVLVVPAGNALCVTTSAAVQMSGSIAYTQF